jgi:predicted porin
MKMKKLLIPALLAASGFGFTTAAHAQFNLYGLVDMCYGKSLLGEIIADERQKADFHSGGDNGSSECNSTTRIGLKGSTDVGSGVKANFRFETGGITSRGSVTNNGVASSPASSEEVNGPFFNRQAWLGLSGSWGEVRLGRQDSVPFQNMIDFDFNGASNGLSAGGYSLVGVFLPGRQTRSLQYISPTFGGFSAHVGFVPKGNRGEDARAVGSLGVKYSTGPLAVGASFQSKEVRDSKAFASVAGSYDFKVVKVMLGYADGGKARDGGTGAGPSIGVNVPVAGFNIGAHYAQNLDDDLEIQSAELWINREVFKNTYAYFEVGNWRSDQQLFRKKSGTGYAVGLIYAF